MSDHGSFLDSLLRAFPDRVSLVNRYSNPTLGLGQDPTLRVFVPDLHWMSAEGQQAYPGYYFNRIKLNGQLLFEIFLHTLNAYRASGNQIEVFQLGDRFDLWREATLKPRSPLTLYNRIRKDPVVGPLADQLDALGTLHVRGNHDHWLKLIETEVPHPRSKDDREAAEGLIFLTHGHRYDQIEFILPDELKAAAVRRYPGAKMHNHHVGFFTPDQLESIRETQDRRRNDHEYPFLPVVRPKGALPIRSVEDSDLLMSQGAWHLDVDVFSHGEGEANDFESRISFLRFAGRIYEEERKRRKPRRLYVIAHSHNARLFVDRHPVDGRPLVTMDCGGWIEYCAVRASAAAGPAFAPSAQVGVQCGNDVRIYQLGSIPEGTPE